MTSATPENHEPAETSDAGPEPGETPHSGPGLRASLDSKPCVLRYIGDGANVGKGHFERPQRKKLRLLAR